MYLFKFIIILLIVVLLFWGFWDSLVVDNTKLINDNLKTKKKKEVGEEDKKFIWNSVITNRRVRCFNCKKSDMELFDDDNWKCPYCRQTIRLIFNGIGTYSNMIVYDNGIDR